MGGSAVWRSTKTRKNTVIASRKGSESCPYGNRLGIIAA
jgi:hypothetical protein